MEGFGYLKPLLLLILGLLGFLQQFQTISLKKPLWKLKIVSIENECKNTSTLDAFLYSELVARDVYAYSGYYYPKIAIGDDVFMEIHSFRSAFGTNNYKRLPFSLPKQTLTQFFNGFFKGVVMPGYKNCSNYIQFDTVWVPPLPPKNYTFNECDVVNDKLPQYLKDGLYKIVAIQSGAIDFTLTLTVQIYNV